MYHLDVDLYRYYIGRAGQSVVEQVMIGRLDQQLWVDRMVLEHAARGQGSIVARRPPGEPRGLSRSPVARRLQLS